MLNESIKKVNFSWEKIENDVKILSDKILENYEPDVILVLAEGGWIPGRLMKNYIEADYYSIGCNNYDEDENILDKVLFYQFIDKSIVMNKKVLILDEVCETGNSLLAVKDKLSRMGIDSVKTAVLHKKDNAKMNIDFVAQNVGNDWIIYPWKG